MSKAAIFLAGMLLGLFLSLYHVRSERDHELGLGPQVGHAVADYDDNDWPPCVDMASSTVIDKNGNKLVYDRYGHFVSVEYAASQGRGI